MSGGTGVNRAFPMATVPYDRKGLGRATAYALGSLVAAQAADYLTFLVMVGAHGLSAELNPIVGALAAQGLGILTLAKASLVVFVGSLFLVSHRQRPRLARFTLGVGIVVGTLGAASNVATL